ncbi:MAG: AMP-binding protein [Bacteroidales bacterium]|nr:AMP-binding protein [Bacteroidales bacterium]
MTVDEFLAEWRNDDAFVTAHTSGSTGKPKEIRLLKADMLASARATNARFGIGEQSRLLLCLSPDYIAGKMMIVRALDAGARLTAIEPHRDLLADYRGDSFDFAAVIPAQAQALADNPDRLARLGTIIVGGGPVSPELESRLAALNADAYSTYGMTETCSHIAVRRIGIDRHYTTLAPTTVSADSRGCLVARLPHLSIGEVTTNDLVDILSPTEFRWRGRIDNAINSGGVKIIPEELEREIADLLDVRYYVGRRPSPTWGEVPVLVVETTNLTDDRRDALLAAMRNRLGIRAPRQIVTLARFDETPTGKVVRR